MLPQPDPRFAHYLEAGRRAHEAGDLDAAVAAYKTALFAQEKNPKLLFLLGNLYLECGQTDAAVANLEQAAAQQRNHPAVVGSLAQAYFAAGRHADAEAAFRKAMRLDPATAGYQIGLANALAMQQKFADAEILLKRVVARFPYAAFAWMNLGNVVRDLARPEQAVGHYRAALRIDPTMVNARNNMGSTLHAMLRFEEAVTEYRVCIATAPDFILARANLASVLIDLGQLAEAEQHCRSIIAAAPDFANAHTLLSAALGMQGRLTEQALHCQHAAALEPHNQRYQETCAFALCEIGEIDEGLRRFGNILRGASDTPMAIRLVTPILLANGFFADGWRNYRTRPDYERIVRHFGHLNLKQSLLPNVAGQHICVVCEQGLGDELFFLRYAPKLKALGARLTYCASPKLAVMLQRVAALDTVVGSTDAIPSADMNILAGDLPCAVSEREYEHEITAMPAPANPGADAGALTAYPWTHAPHAPLPPPSLRIAPLPASLTAVRDLLARAGPPPYLGITWRGGTAPDQQRGATWKLFKEIALPPLAAALNGWPGTMLALQRNPAAGELEQLQTALGRLLVDFTALNENLEHMLALLALIDDYVGVSNTNMHLRAAAGQTARVLVPCPAEWRWMAAGTSPWFPGFGIYRQTFDGRWDDALAALQRDLAGRHAKIAL